MRYLILFASLCGLLAAAAHADSDTAAIYRAAKANVFQIRILESESGTREAYGSGFSADAQGRVITNYHVVSDIIDRPGKYHIDAVDTAGHHQDARLLAFDAVNDLALLQVGTPAPGHIAVETAPTEQGARLFSIGLPLDQDFTISEGTYNGLLPNTLRPRIHFTGPINPGVSGGPTIDERGLLVGVNVSTMGNSVGHLVPAAQVAALLAHAGNRPLDAAQASAELARQFSAHQADFIGKLTSAPWARVSLGPYTVPGQIAPWMKCWANNEHAPTALYETTNYLCEPGDGALFVTERFDTSAVSLQHTLVTARTLGRVRFSWLMTQQAADNWGKFSGSREDAGNFQCQDGVVNNGALKLNTRLCVRKLQKFPGLYDAALQTLTLGGPHSTGLVSQLNINGASFANIQRLGREFVEQIR